MEGEYCYEDLKDHEAADDNSNYEELIGESKTQVFRCLLNNDGSPQLYWSVSDMSGGSFSRRQKPKDAYPDDMQIT